MLILSRKPNESLMIGDDVEVVILEVKGDQVKLGIKAPKRVSVYRKEIYENIQRENLEASKVTLTTLDSLKKLHRGGEISGS